MNFVDGATDHSIHGDRFVGSEHVLCFVVAVDVRGHEVDRDIFFGNVLDEVVGPSGLGRRGAANAQTRTHRFQGDGGDIVQMIVGRFFRLTRPKIQVGLIPHFEIPLRHFVDAVAID